MRNMFPAYPESAPRPPMPAPRQVPPLLPAYPEPAGATPAMSDDQFVSSTFANQGEEAGLRAMLQRGLTQARAQPTPQEQSPIFTPSEYNQAPHRQRPMDLAQKIAAASQNANNGGGIAQASNNIVDQFNTQSFGGQVPQGPPQAMQDMGARVLAGDQGAFERMSFLQNNPQFAASLFGGLPQGMTPDSGMLAASGQEAGIDIARTRMENEQAGRTDKLNYLREKFAGEQALGGRGLDIREDEGVRRNENLDLDREATGARFNRTMDYKENDPIRQLIGRFEKGGAGGQGQAIAEGEINKQYPGYQTKGEQSFEEMKRRDNESRMQSRDADTAIKNRKLNAKDPTILSATKKIAGEGGNISQIASEAASKMARGYGIDISEVFDARDANGDIDTGKVDARIDKLADHIFIATAGQGITRQEAVAMANRHVQFLRNPELQAKEASE